MNADARDRTLGALLRTATPVSTSRIAWLNRVRAEALERANALTLPTTRDEDWRFTNLAPLTRVTFQPPTVAGPIDAAAIAGSLVPEAAAVMVCVNGVMVPALSRLPGPDSPLQVGSLGDALDRHPEMVEAHLARHARFRDDPFAALNTAFLQDCAVVYVPRGVKAAPVHLLFASTAQAAPHAMYPRVLVVVENGAEAVLVEEYAGLAGTTGHVWLTDSVTEVSVGEQARLQHVRIQMEGDVAFHIGHCVVAQARASRYHVSSVALGARLSRLGLMVTQGAEGTETVLDGLALIGGKQLADTHSTMDHACPRGRLTQVHRAVVDGEAHSVFNGRILVREGAQQTDASQSSRNLLLSPRAHVDTKPQLEIFADDVKCAHGAAVGQLEEEEVFYLRSRGLSEPAARGLLTYAFAAEVVDRIPVASVAARLRTRVLERTERTFA
jgi:Fe-S cluster assembly protein SufD